MARSPRRERSMLVSPLNDIQIALLDVSLACSSRKNPASGLGAERVRSLSGYLAFARSLRWSW